MRRPAEHFGIENNPRPPGLVDFSGALHSRRDEVFSSIVPGADRTAGCAPGRVGVARRNSPRSARARRRQPEGQYRGGTASVSAGGDCESKLPFGGRSLDRTHTAASTFPPAARHLRRALDRGTPARSPTLKDRSLVRSFDCIESETATPTPGCQGRPGPPRPRRGTKINPIPRKKPHRRGAPSPRCRHLHCSSPAREPPGRT